MPKLLFGGLVRLIDYTQMRSIEMDLFCTLWHRIQMVGIPRPVAGKRMQSKIKDSLTVCSTIQSDNVWSTIHHVQQEHAHLLTHIQSFAWCKCWAINLIGYHRISNAFSTTKSTKSIAAATMFLLMLKQSKRITSKRYCLTKHVAPTHCTMHSNITFKCQPIDTITMIHVIPI